VKTQSSKEKKIPKKSAPKKKSNEEKRNAVPVYGVEEYRIWRIYDAESKRWVPGTMGRRGKKEVDSRLHRFGREVGFCSLEMLGSVLDDHLKAVEERIWHIIHMPKSAVWRV
jgi:hypothetical protein